MRTIRIVIALFLLLLITPPSYSQCSMCRAVAETGAKDESLKVGRGLNNGILYLLAMPYIIGGVAFYIWRKNRRKNISA
ncbi:MAG: hypothetical protein M3Q95_10710 [Bacteroidota bacterium]|nr:hypothetical protein [Bacteroidota bacterium]